MNRRNFIGFLIGAIATPLILKSSEITETKESIKKDTFKQIKIKDIIVPKYFKQCSNRNIDILKDSIQRLGQCMPIVVRPCGNKYLLVDGLHRIVAMSAANIETVEAYIDNLDFNIKEYRSLQSTPYLTHKEDIFKETYGGRLGRV